MADVASLGNRTGSTAQYKASWLERRVRHVWRKIKPVAASCRAGNADPIHLRQRRLCSFPLQVTPASFSSVGNETVSATMFINVFTLFNNLRGAPQRLRSGCDPLDLS